MRSRLKCNVCAVIGAINNYSPASYILMVENQEILFEVDTGACVSIISEEEYIKCFKNLSLIACKEKFVVSIW